MKKFIPITTLLALLPVLVFAQTRAQAQPTANVVPVPENTVDANISLGTDAVEVGAPDPDQPVIDGSVSNGESANSGNTETTFKVEKGEKDGAGSIDNAGSEEPDTAEGDAFLRLDDDDDGDGIAEIELDDDDDDDSIPVTDDDDGEEDSDENHSDWIDVDSVRWGAVGGSTVFDDVSSFANIASKNSGEVVIKGKKIAESTRVNVRRMLGVDDIPEEAADIPDKEVRLDFGKIDTKEELSEYAGLLVVSDENIKRIDLDVDKVALKYKYPAKLLWVIPVSYTARVEVDKDGGVDVKFPWWMFLVRDTAEDIRQELLGALSQDSANRQYNETDLDVAARLQSQQEVLKIISGISKRMYDSAMAIIRNIR